MPPFIKSLITVACSVCLLAACSSHNRSVAARAATAHIPTPARPSPPRRGEPINIVEFAYYFENESLNLLHQGRVATNLLRQPRPQSCSLKLAPPRLRPLASDELPQTTEMGVAVVGRILKVAGKPRLTPTASGFFLTDSGALATCRHVIDSDRIIGLTVMTRDGQVCPVRQVLAVHTNLDLAILQVQGTGFTPLSLAPNVRQGAPVWVLSHPFPNYYMLTSGIVSGYYMLESPGANVTMFCTTADFADGSSGGPVLNESGAVVGVATFRQTVGEQGTAQMRVSGCLPSSALLTMINPQTTP
jgi:S1-C subfamily serine protease